MPARSARIISRHAVRRFLLEAQDLLADHHYSPEQPATPERVLRELRRLEAVQLDPVAAVERNQHLVLAARVPGYAAVLLERLLARRRVFEYWAHTACVFPMEDYPIFEGKRRRGRTRLKPELDAIRLAARAVLARLEREGPLPARAFISDHRVHGWWDIKGPKTKITSHALNILWHTGQVMVVRREGLERSFDLPDRAVPAELLRQARAIDEDDADRALLAKYMRTHRVFDIGDGAFGWRKISAPQRRTMIEQLVRAGTVVPLSIEGVRQRYFILAEDEDRLRRHGRAARGEGQGSLDGPVRFLPPLDNLLWRRARITDFFDFAYTWEVYVPAARRTYGYYTMPILVGDRLIGRLDPRLDRERRRLLVNLLDLERAVTVTARLRSALGDALHAFARFHGATDFRVVRSRPARVLR